MSSGEVFLAAPVRSCLALCAIAATLLAAGAALAQEPPTKLTIAVVGASEAVDQPPPSACPSASSVVDELRLLMPEVKLETSVDPARSDVVVSDREATFSVNVRGQRRRFEDKQRDCTERARHVAVFTVLIVDPLRVPSSVVAEAESAEKGRPSEPALVVPSPVYVPPPSPPSRPPAFDLSLGPIVRVAVQSEQEGTTRAGGLGLRLRYGGNLGVALGVAGLLPTSLHFENARARATWLPFDLGVSLAQQVASWEVSFDMGLGGAVLLVKGDALDTSERATRLELGGRVGVQVRYWASARAGVYGGLSGVWFPKPYTLEVQGLGVVGQTPSGWIGGSLGAVIRL